MTHQNIFSLLPWYINGTLTDQERQAVQKHLTGCAICTRQLEELKAVQMGVVELNEEVPIPSPNLLGRALNDIEEYEQAKTRTHSKQKGWVNTVLEWFQETWPASWQPVPTFARVVITVQLILLVGLGGWVTTLWSPYSTLTGPSTSIQEDRARLVIGFHPHVSEAEIRKTLQEIQGTIVKGPSALGLYTIEVPLSPDQTQEIENRLQALKQNQNIIRFAEREP